MSVLERDELVHNLTQLGPSHKIAKREREDVGRLAVAKDAAPVGKRRLGKDDFKGQVRNGRRADSCVSGVCSLLPRRSIVISRFEGLTPLSY
jgi:hypothetical protein